MADVKADLVVEAYVNTRDHIAALKKQCKEETDKLEALQGKREKWLHQQLDESGQNSASIKGVGTYFTKKVEYLSVEDMDVFVKFLDDNKAWDLLNKAVNKSAALERMGEDRDLSKVPGLKYSSEIEVQVRRS